MIRIDIKGNSRPEFHGNIEKLTVDNTNFRKVLYTSKEAQLVVMSLAPRDEIGEEVHGATTQFIRIEEGSGVAIVDGRRISLNADDVIMIPSGARHNIINTGRDKLKLYTVYSPPEHPEGTIQRRPDK